MYSEEDKRFYYKFEPLMEGFMMRGERDYYTGEQRCKRCHNWFDTQQLHMGLCDRCLEEIQKDIDHRTKGSE